MTREEVFDREIAPHVEAIYRLCQEHRIPFFTVFGLDRDELVTAALPKGFSAMRIVTSYFFPADQTPGGFVEVRDYFQGGPKPEHN